MKNIAMAFIAAYLVVEFSQANLANAQTFPTQQLEAVIERLELTDEQRSQAEPILFNGFEERQAILLSAGIEPGKKPKLSQMMKVRSPLMASQARTESELSAVLTDQQMAEYRAAVEEIRQHMRAQFQ